MHPHCHIDCVQLGFHIPTLPPSFLPAGTPTSFNFVLLIVIFCLKTTEDAIKFFRLLRAGCRMRGLEWWLNNTLDEFPSVDAREAVARALNKAKCIDQLMEQVLDTALAPQGGIRLDMNDAEETPAPAKEDAPRAPTSTPSTNFKSSLLPHGTYGLKTIEIRTQTTVTAALGEGSFILDTASLHERPGTASLKVVKSIFAPRTTQCLGIPADLPHQ
jgi:hypothetical protein